MAVQADGRILVAGETQIYFGEMAVVRLLPDGSRDPTWQKVPAEFRRSPGDDYHVHSSSSALTLLPGGKAMVGGLANGSLGFVRLNPDGTHDRTFGRDGLLALPVTPGAPPVAIVPTPASGLLAVATSGSASWPTEGFLLARVAVAPLGAPSAVSAVAGSGSARVSWTRPPLFDEGPLVAYTVTASDGVHTVTTPDAEHLSGVVRGLIPGRSYTFTVHAVRAGGDGPRSSPSNPVTAGISSPMSAWGWNGATQLGDGTASDRWTPGIGVGTPGVVALAGGTYHSVALRADGTVWAWGWNGYGQLGDGSTATRTTAVRVPGLSDVVSVSAGVVHSLALRADGTVWAWGWNGLGQLGTGTTVDSRVPVRVTGLTGIKAIAAGFHHSLAVRSDGTVVSWGWNVLGQLGDGSTLDSRSPKAVPGLTDVTAVAGGGLHSLALGSDGRVRAWGWNGAGQLGTGDTVDHRTPTTPLTPTGVVAIAAGAYHNYALEKEGIVRSWGWNAQGQLGNTSTGPRPGILSVWYLTDVASIAAGWFHGLAVRHDGSVVAWGANGFGQLGDGTRTDRNTFAPVAVPSALAVGAGAYHSLSS